MLVLGRRVSQKICVGEEIVITLVDSRPGFARIGIEAPPCIPIHRPEAMNKTGVQRTKSIYQRHAELITENENLKRRVHELEMERTSIRS